MRKIFASICKKVIAAIALAGLSGMGALAADLPAVKANHTWIPVNIDGELEDQVWGDIASSVDGFILYNNGEKATENTKAYITYDRKYLYVAFVCYDSDISGLKGGDRIFNGDCVEVFIDPGRSLEYTHVAVTPDGKIYLAWQQNDRKNSVRAAAKRFSDRWQVEIAIPFTDIKMPDAAAMKPDWGINFCRAMPRKKEFSCWAPTLAEFHNPTRFGNMRGIRDIDTRKIRLVQNSKAADSPDALQVVTDRSFYDVQKQITVCIELKNPLDLKGKSLRLSVVDEKGKLRGEKEIKDILLTNKETFDVASLPDGNYFLKTEVLENGKPVAAAEKFFGKFAPMKKPESCAEIRNGILYADGKPYLPTGIWFGAPWHQYKDLSESDLADVADKGFTAILPSWGFFKDEFAAYGEIAKRAASDGRLKFAASNPFNMERLLDTARSNKLQVIFNIPFFWRTESLDDDQIRVGGEIVRKYRNHPAVLCWNSNDETDGWNALNRETYRLYKELDPHRPVYLNLIYAVPSNRDAADILSTDPYPIGKAPITKVAAHGNMIREALRDYPSKSAWLVLQLFGSPAEKWPRCPTPAEERCMTFLALNHGAKGLVYFTYRPKAARIEGGSKFLSEELWQSMKELNRQTKEMALPYLLGKDAAGISCNDKSIDLAAREYNGKVYIIACNTRDVPLDAVDIEIGSGALPKEVAVKFENRNVPLENGRTVKDSFSGYAVHIYTYALK
ncbi:MAG: Beta-galactosidase [Lentisphaerae bacterium ADurb.Bin242]|nr:MAG: Beta-galactosidase [Lentisphaerae bacterium ADurb.Bin242]